MTLRRDARPAAPAWHVYAAGWLPLVAVYVALFVAWGAKPGQALRTAIASALPAAVFGVPLVGLRIAPPQGRGARLVLEHVARAAAFVVAATALWAGLIAVDCVARGVPFRLDGRIVGWQVLLSVLLYGVLAAVAQARQEASRLAEQTQRLAAAEALRARAELQALRSQLNPHFVLNALHTLHALVRRDPERAELAIEELGRLLAYGLRQQRQDVDEVTLADEWAFVGDYVRIERLRFGDRLAVVLDGAPDALTCRLPPFSIQPLVENAILHAVAPRAAGGAVRVEARRSGDVLRVFVRDDGPGVLESSGDGLGLGLRLIEQRLAVLYGAEARLRVTARDGGGTEVSLEVPQRENACEDA